MQKYIRERFPGMTIWAMAMMLTFCWGFAHASDMKPNVLFIAVDDLRPELGCYDNTHIKTPFIDKFAEGALVFHRAYVQVPVCGASRANLMTGILPTPKRFVDYRTRVDEDAPNAKTLPQVFKADGYTTISNGKIFHVQIDSQDRSWSEPAWRPADKRKSYDPETTRRLSEKKQRGRIYEHPDVPDNAYYDGLVAEKTINDLQRFAKTKKPFFLACGFVRPHMPFYAPKKYWDLYERESIQLANNRSRPQHAPEALKGSKEYTGYHLADYTVNSDEWHRMMRHGYYASVSYVDQLIGNVLAELTRLDLADNTIVVLWGDHGWHLGEHDFWGKHNTMHLSLRVPLIIRVPGKVSGKSDALIETGDIFPTLCTLANLEIPETVQGKNFVSILNHPEKPFRDNVYARFGSGDTIITKDFAFTRYKDETEMFYDHRNDPDENLNVVKMPQYQASVTKIRQLLNSRMHEANSAIIGKK